MWCPDLLRAESEHPGPTSRHHWPPAGSLPEVNEEENLGPALKTKHNRPVMANAYGINFLLTSEKFKSLGIENVLTIVLLETFSLKIFIRSSDLIFNLLMAYIIIS